MNKVIILSGPSGSGKSTFASQMFPEATVCSADHFHINAETGEYKYDPSKAAQAHATCMYDFLLALERGDEVIVVDNTNLSRWERRNYILAATLMGWVAEVHFFSCVTVEDIKTCAARNKHGVPIEIVSAMALRHEHEPSGRGSHHHGIGYMHTESQWFDDGRR